MKPAAVGPRPLALGLAGAASAGLANPLSLPLETRAFCTTFCTTSGGHGRAPPTKYERAVSRGWPGGVGQGVIYGSVSQGAPASTALDEMLLPTPWSPRSSRQAEVAAGLGRIKPSAQRITGVPRYQEAEARAATLQAQIARHQQIVVSEARGVEQQLDEALVVEQQLPPRLRQHLTERSWNVGIAPPATGALVRVVELVAPPVPRTARLRTKRGSACVAPAYLPQLHDARAARSRTRSGPATR